MKLASRMERLPPYLFAEMDRRMEEARRAGVDVINLAIGDPDEPTPPSIVESLGRHAANPAYHQYPPYQGLRAFREAVARWFEGRYGVKLDPEREVLALIGSKEGLAHMAWCLVEPGSVGLVPDPGYPVYATAVELAGGEAVRVPLRPERGYVPDLASLPEEVCRRARILYLNYPNNPTGAVADLSFFQEAVEWARRWGVAICHDAAYNEITYSGRPAPSILQVPGAMEVAIEMHSLSKTFNMTGWRIGWACGSPQLVGLLGTLKTHLDSGVFGAIQMASVEALEQYDRFIGPIRELYRRRRDRVVQALAGMGWSVTPPEGALYVWAPVPPGWDSVRFAAELLSRAGVVVTPGIGYGPSGEGYFRISLTVPDARLEQALARWREHGIWFHTPRPG
ncbi:MAG TPA: LL-diaminopimelate aminotransferase [Limnochordales bacterium]